MVYGGCGKLGKINDHGRINESGIEIKKLPAEAGSLKVGFL